MKWISVKDQLPEICDDSVLVYFPKNQAIAMVYIEDYFDDITAGIINGVQQYTKWYIPQGVTHWMPLPEPPIDN